VGLHKLVVRVTPDNGDLTLFLQLPDLLYDAQLEVLYLSSRPTVR